MILLNHFCLQGTEHNNEKCTKHQVGNNIIRSQLVEKIRQSEMMAKHHDVRIKMRKFTRSDGDPRPGQSHADFILEAVNSRDCCLAEAKLARDELIAYDNRQANVNQLASSFLPG